jgi:hypothetical protein
MNVHNRSAPSGDRSNAPVTARYDALSFVALGSGISDILPRFPQIINQQGTTKRPFPVKRGLTWENAAVVEITSEEKEHPDESALVSADSRGWRAADSGIQTIRLIFDKAQRLRCISLVFEETKLLVHKSSFCAGLRVAATHSKKLCVSSGISAHLSRHAKSKNIN